MHKIKTILKKQGFTLVELIIVIAIIAVLAIAAFMVLTKWLGKSRDSRRLSDLGTITRGLQVGYSDVDDGINMYPTIKDQDGMITLLSGTKEVGYQGIVDLDVVKGASMQKVPLDPSDNNEYTYLVTQNRQKFQVLGMLEDGTEVGVLNYLYALEYKNRVPTTKGFELGVMLQKVTNLPVQYAGLTETGIDLKDETKTTNFKVIVNETKELVGTGIVNAPIANEDTIVVENSGGSSTPQVITYNVVSCPVGKTEQNGTATKADIVASINDYIGCKISGYEMGDLYIAGLTNSDIDVLLTLGVDDSIAISWGCSTNTLGTTNSDGKGNTLLIVDECSSNTTAAELCYNKGTGNKWYLPIRTELDLLYTNRAIIGGFSESVYYWTSEEVNNESGLMLNFSNGSGAAGHKTIGTTSRRAHCVRILE